MAKPQCTAPATTRTLNPIPGLPEITPAQVHALARRVGFEQRTNRGIAADAFVAAVLTEAVRGAPSFNDLAARIAATTGRQVSRQAVAARTDQHSVQLFQELLAVVLGWRLPMPATLAAGSTEFCQRCLLQDSTIVQLPARLFASFSGVANAQSRTCHARIQCCYDLRAGRFLSFAIDPYTKNDIAAAPELELRPGDLGLRDRGYLSYDEVRRHVVAGAHCIYRHKSAFTYLDVDTGQALDLTTLLEQHGTLDREVLLHNPERTRVRLLAAPVDEETANRRQQQLKRETKGHRPGAELLRQQRWTILITTIPAALASFTTILALYALRWRIEIIFKTWKCSLNFAAIHNVSEPQLRLLLTARLLSAVAFYHGFYLPACGRIQRDYQKTLSLAKAIRHVAKHPDQLPALTTALADPTAPQAALAALARYGCYDCRRRRNFHQQWQALQKTRLVPGAATTPAPPARVA
jgi:hypothetical protein